MAILLLVSGSCTPTNVNTDQFENQFSTNPTSLFFSKTSSAAASSHPEPSRELSTGPNAAGSAASRAADAGPNYGLPVASVDKSIAVHRIEVNRVHSNQSTSKRPASDSKEGSRRPANAGEPAGNREAASLAHLGSSTNSAHSTRRADQPELQRNQQVADQSERTPDQAADKSETERWSDWSDCSVACGIGVQTQRLESRAQFSSIKYKVCKKQVSSFRSTFIGRQSDGYSAVRRAQDKR